MRPALLAWYRKNKRTMPWRGHPDPYAVWVSEIMLQQTQVATATPYFDRFMKAFPTVQALAAAPEQEVLCAWQGLGYYTRARNLHRAAKQVAATHGGTLPRTAAALRELPGIGGYTAAAIASICFHEEIPVVDGNVLRIVSRVLALEDDIRSRTAHDRVTAWLAHLMRDVRVPGDFNQAMMELGALVCTPRHSQCGTCPWARHCEAHRRGDVTRFPVKEAARPVPVRREDICVATSKGRILLVRRTGQRLLGEMWELPPLSRFTDTQRQRFTSVGAVKHTYSHFTLILNVWKGDVTRLTAKQNEALVSPADLPRYPISRAPLKALTILQAQPLQAVPIVP
ncbi:MAG: A/G-specific adenine glycosylase [Kiritimatiellaeota bacterium]|nr:A/G-specific adenine glycosylase [Kiritimatiellota bacterium]